MTCEVAIKSESSRKKYPCGKPAVYWWTPRSNKNWRQPMCKECGEAHAGNFKDELTPIEAK